MKRLREATAIAWDVLVRMSAGFAVLTVVVLLMAALET